MIAIQDRYERRATDSLVPYARNSRTHSEDQIAQIVASIKEWGFTTPVLIDEDGGIIAGHGRVMAATRLRLPEVPVLVATGWTEAQRRAYVIADNKLALNAGWDEEVLAAEIADLQALGFDLELTGFDADELLDMLADEGQNGATEDDVVPEPPPQPVTRPGDVWVLGAHRVMCGDSTEPSQVAALMDGAQADMLLTDPPCNVAHAGRTADALKIQNDAMGSVEFRALLARAFGAALACMKAGAVFYIWHPDSEGYNFRGACHDSGMQVRQCLIWKKPSMVVGRQDYHWRHEPCLYGWKDGAGHLWASDRKQTTILEFDRPSRNEDHPTMKPMALFEYQILNNTKGSDVVLDSFGGSGTTLIACQKNDRIARIMELDPVNVDVIVARWQAFTGSEATLAGTGMGWGAVAAQRAAEAAQVAA